MSDSSSTQLASVITIANECQKIVARHDELLFKIKALAVTLWSASTGWALTNDNPLLMSVGLFATLGLWFVAATFRGSQKRYIRRSDSAFTFLTDHAGLTELSTTGCLPSDVPRNLAGYEPRIERAKLVLNGLVSPTVAFFYAFFAAISIGLLVATAWE